MTRCNCNDECYRCDVGNKGDDCTCFNPCPIHQPGAVLRNESRLSARAGEEWRRNHETPWPKEKLTRNHFTGEVVVAEAPERP